MMSSASLRSTEVASMNKLLTPGSVVLATQFAIGGMEIS